MYSCICFLLVTGVSWATVREQSSMRHFEYGAVAVQISKVCAVIPVRVGRRDGAEAGRQHIRTALHPSSRSGGNTSRLSSVGALPAVCPRCEVNSRCQDWGVPASPRQTHRDRRSCPAASVKPCAYMAASAARLSVDRAMRK